MLCLLAGRGSPHPAQGGVEDAVLEEDGITGAVAGDAVHLQHIAVCTCRQRAGKKAQGISNEHEEDCVRVAASAGRCTIQ